jgi:sodium-dependent phosphate cotransporter
MLASLATGSPNAVVVAFVHLLFNITGIGIWFPLRKLPLFLARRVSDIAIKNKIFPFAYIITVFFLVPLAVILLLR